MTETCIDTPQEKKMQGNVYNDTPEQNIAEECCSWHHQIASIYLKNNVRNTRLKWLIQWILFTLLVSIN